MAQVAPRLSSALYTAPAAAASTDADGAPEGESADERLAWAITNDKEVDAIGIVYAEQPTAHKSSASVLLRAIKGGLVALAEVLINDGARVWQESAKSSEQPMPVCCVCAAAKLGDVHTMRMLVACGAVGHLAAFNYHYRHVHDFACYASAAWEGKLEIIEFLLSDGPAVPSRVHGTMLLYALRRGHTDIVRLLLRKGAHRPTFGDVDTALRTGRADMLVHLVRAGGVDMRAHECTNERAAAVSTIARVADAACAGKCPPEVLRRLLECTAMAWTVDGTDTDAYTPRRVYPVSATTENRPQWLAVVGALTTHGWTCVVTIIGTQTTRPFHCSADTPDMRKHVADAHAAGLEADAAHDADYAASVYDPKGDDDPNDNSSSGPEAMATAASPNGGWEDEDAKSSSGGAGAGAPGPPKHRRRA